MDTAEDINLERWVSAEGRWKSLSSALLPNTGVFIWDAPSALETPLLLRIQAAFEDGIEHVVQVPVHVG